MSKQRHMRELLEANPGAKKDEAVIRDALREVKNLRKAGIKARGYQLIAPFGDKRQLRANEGLLSGRYAK